MYDEPATTGTITKRSFLYMETMPAERRKKRIGNRQSLLIASVFENALKKADPY